MTQEKAIETLRKLPVGLMGLDNEQKWDLMEAIDLALTALRGPTREMVERAWFRELYTRMETRSTPEGNRQYIAENTCMACGSKTPIGHFCHNCGVALDDWGVDMMLERWKEAVDGE